MTQRPVPRGPLSKAQLANFRATLLEHRRQVLGDLDQLSHEAREGLDEISPPPLSQSEPGTEPYARQFVESLAANERNLLWAIDHALARIDEGTYGICEVSGEPISYERLEAKPWARTTIEVARQQEQGRG